MAVKTVQVPQGNSRIINKTALLLSYPMSESNQQFRVSPLCRITLYLRNSLTQGYILAVRHLLEISSIIIVPLQDPAWYVVSEKIPALKEDYLASIVYLSSIDSQCHFQFNKILFPMQYQPPQLQEILINIIDSASRPKSLPDR